MSCRHIQQELHLCCNLGRQCSQELHSVWRAGLRAVKAMCTLSWFPSFVSRRRLIWTWGVSISVALNQEARWFLQTLLRFQEAKAGC